MKKILLLFLMLASSCNGGEKNPFSAKFGLLESPRGEELSVMINQIAAYAHILSNKDAFEEDEFIRQLTEMHSQFSSPKESKYHEVSSYFLSALNASLMAEEEIQDEAMVEFIEECVSFQNERKNKLDSRYMCLFLTYYDYIRVCANIKDDPLRSGK